MADEQPQGKPAVLDLDEHVDQLLEQMDTECARLESHSPAPIGQDKPADPPAPPPEPEPQPEPQPAGEEPTAEVEAPPAPATEEPEASTPSELDADLDAKVGEMIAEAERAEDAEDAPTPEAPPPLDAGENDADEGTVSASETETDAAEADSCLADLTSQLLSGELDMDDAAFGSTEDPAAVATSPDRPAASARTHAIKKPNPVLLLATRARKLAGRGLSIVLPVGATGVMKLNSPLESRDPTVRQTVGWMALYTGFLALCVWGYLLLIRSPEAPPPATVPAALVGENAASDQGPGSSADSPALTGSPSVARQD